MADSKAALTRDELIKLELQGKDQAVAGYDEIIWKIRAGYAAVLYGSLTLLGGKENWRPPSPNAAVIACMLIIGFTVCALVLDLSFLRRKLRVVQARDKLIGLAWERAVGTEPNSPEEKIEALLINAGETDDQVIWSGRNARLSVAMLYGTTVIVGLVAVLLRLACS